MRGLAAPRTSPSRFASPSLSPLEGGEALLSALSGLSLFVFDRAAVGPGRGNGHRLAGGERIERGDDIVMRGLDVGEAGRRLVVDGTHIDDTTGAVDHDHMRRRARVIEAADYSLGVEQEIGWRCPPTREVRLGVSGSDIALLAGRRRSDRQP